MLLGIDKQIEELNELIHSDYDAIGAYDTALHDIHEALLRDPLIQFRADHERHIQLLAREVLRLGGRPADKADLKGVVRKTMTKVAGLGGVELTLKAMRSNEELLTRTYAHHFALDWPDDVKEVIRQGYADEQRHLAWIVEALRNRLWESAARSPMP